MAGFDEPTLPPPSRPLALRPAALAAGHVGPEHAALLACLSRALVEHGEIPRADLAAMLGLQVWAHQVFLAAHGEAHGEVHHHG